MTELTNDERELLASYRNGPRIWDAASIYPTVTSLAQRGLIQPSGGAAYELTNAGQAVLAAQPRETTNEEVTLGNWTGPVVIVATDDQADRSFVWGPFDNEGAAKSWVDDAGWKDELAIDTRLEIVPLLNADGPPLPFVEYVNEIREDYEGNDDYQVFPRSQGGGP